jgi:cyanophycinase
MITGNEYKHSEYTGDFRTIEAKNIEIAEGLGLLENCIVDQHFIKRMRMNRLISASLENPNYSCIGIDESTAIIVSGDSAKVVGESQVIVLINKQQAQINDKELLGGININLCVYLPGEKFLLDIE